MAVQGLDVSSIQGKNFNFNNAKAAGYEFVILRINTWDNVKRCNVKDPCFDSFYQKATAAGLKVGAYWFSYANTVDYVATEAALCIDWIKGKKFEYPIYFDLERREQFTQGMTFCDAAVKTFCNALEAAGYFVGVYCSTFWYTKCVSKAIRERYACWIAEYASSCHYTSPYGIWQNGLVYVNGVQVDHDYAYVDYPAIIKKKGLNGFPKPESKPAELKALDTGSCYKIGETTVGALAVKELLRLAYGKKLIKTMVNDTKVYDAKAVEAVKELQKKWGYKETGGAGENFVKKLYEALK